LMPDRRCRRSTVSKSKRLPVIRREMDLQGWVFDQRKHSTSRQISKFTRKRPFLLFFTEICPVDDLPFNHLSSQWLLTARSYFHV
jgi:hypothetical protein